MKNPDNFIKEYVVNLDAIRKLTAKEVFPELANIL